MTREVELTENKAKIKTKYKRLFNLNEEHTFNEFEKKLQFIGFTDVKQ